MTQPDIQLVLAELNSIRQQMTDMQKEFNSLIESAVPSGDLTAHRAYHESLIEANRLKSEFFRKLLFELAKWGLISVLGWALVTFIRGMKNGI